MTLTELINDLISIAIASEDDPEVEVSNMEEPVIILHDNKIILTDRVHGEY